MAERDFVYMLAMLAYCACAFLFVKRFAHHIWSYLIVGVMYIPYFMYVGLNMKLRSYFDLLNLICYAIFAGGVVLLLLCAKVAWKNFYVLRTFFVLFAITLVAVYIDAFHIEPHWLSVRQEQMSSSKITKPLKIAVVADIQTDDVGDYEREVLLKIKRYAPDLLLFAGDYIQLYDENRDSQHAKLNSLLKEIAINPPLGTFVARGDVDSPDDWSKCFEGLPFNIASESTTLKIAEDLTVTILSLQDSRFSTYKVPDTAGFHIVVGHAPDYSLSAPQADLLVAGHTHGGQVHVPLFGPPITLSNVPRNWGKGCWTDIGTGAMLCVSRGVGMERVHAPRLRFLCRPEVVFIDVNPIAANFQ